MQFPMRKAIQREQVSIGTENQFGVYRGPLNVTWKRPKRVPDFSQSLLVNNKFVSGENCSRLMFALLIESYCCPSVRSNKLFTESRYERMWNMITRLC